LLLSDDFPALRPLLRARDERALRRISGVAEGRFATTARNSPAG